MFQDLTAWFSSSVENRSKQLWKDHGGSEVNFDDAQFVFSADNAAPDTERVFRSTAYESDHLAVFHSQYISDSIRAGDRSKVVLGRYFLPPKDIVDLVRKQMTFCWDVQPSVSSIQRQTDRQRVSNQPHSTGAASNRQRSSSTPQQQASTSAAQRNLRSAGTESRQQADRLPQISPRQQRQRTSQGSSRRSQSPGTVDGSSSRPNQRSDPGPSTRQSQPPDKRSDGRLSKPNQQSDSGTSTRQSEPDTRSDRSSSRPNQRSDSGTATRHSQYSDTRSEQQPNQDSAVQGKHNQTSERLSTQSSSTHKRTVESTSSTHSPSKRRRREASSAQQSHQKTANTSVREPSNSSDSRGATTATRTQATEQTNSNSPRRRCVAEPGRDEGQTAQRQHHRRQGDTTSVQLPSDRALQTEYTEIAVVHISKLTKVMASELMDFIPGQDGAQVLKKGVV